MASRILRYLRYVAIGRRASQPQPKFCMILIDGQDRDIFRNTPAEQMVPGSAWSVLYHASMHICDEYGLPNGREHQEHYADQHRPRKLRSA